MVLVLGLRQRVWALDQGLPLGVEETCGIARNMSYLRRIALGEKDQSFIVLTLDKQGSIMGSERRTLSLFFDFIRHRSSCNFLFEYPGGKEATVMIRCCCHVYVSKLVTDSGSIFHEQHGRHAWMDTASK